MSSHNKGFCHSCRLEKCCFYKKDKYIFKYQLSLINNKIVEENLYMRIEHNDNAVIVFERSENDFFLGDELKDISVGKLKNTMSILSFISLNYDNEIIKQIIDWFFSISILDFDNTQYSAENREGRRVYKVAWSNNS
ncbi:hypothetical protein [Hungatella effluvii]|uniref:hypothetical protein n=1 Tax=Hungatella effluvii TaxID=1096246 RepID=UPI0022E49F4B|nr:hypothetical protein [Hungatella effluvii]